MPETYPDTDMKSSEIDHNHYDIAISGGSFIGLTLAEALSKSSNNSLKIAVVDLNKFEISEQNSDYRAFALSASSVNLLNALNIWPQIKKYAQPVTKIEITDTSLEAAIRPALIDFDNVNEEDKPSSYIIENKYLLDTLRKAVSQRNNITLIPETAIRSFENTGSNVKINLNTDKTLAAKLLIAADGKNSVLRKQAGIKTIGWSYDQMGIVATISHKKSHEGTATQHFLPSGPFAILPLTENRSSLVWSEKTKLAKQFLSLNQEDFLEEVKKRAGRHLGDIELASPYAGFPLILKVAREFVTDRFALIGDAAHGIHPIAGLGLNIGLRDVAALTEVIIDAQRLGLDFGRETTLQKYATWRRFDSTVSAFTMDVLNRLFSNDNGPLRTIRDFGLGLVSRSEPLKKYFVKEAAGLSGEVPLLLQGKNI